MIYGHMWESVTFSDSDYLIKGDVMHQILAKCVQEFEKDEATMLDYESVRRIFENYPENVDKVTVNIKFSILNNLYRTNIWASDQMTNYIYKLAIEDDLDTLLKSGNPNAVNKISIGHGIKRKGTEYRFYSFATKYCHFSNPGRYPIYDQYVKKAIIKLQKNNYIQLSNQNDLYDPQKFRDIIYQIIQKSGLKTYQKADRALWVYGQHLSGK